VSPQAPSLPRRSGSRQRPRPASRRSLVTRPEPATPARQAMATQPARLATTHRAIRRVTTRPDHGDQGQEPGAQCVHARCLRSLPATRQSRALAAAGAPVPGALAASGRVRCHPQRGMVGIGHRDLAACTRAGSPSCHAAADAGGCSRHNRASARRCRGHQRQAPAAAPEPPAAGRLAAAAAAGPCRPGTSPVRPDTVRAVSRTCRPGGFTPAIHWPETCGYSYTGDTRGHGEHLRPGERRRSPQSRTATRGILQLARTITDRVITSGRIAKRNEELSGRRSPHYARLSGSRTCG
jgi:hypothetical protein